MKSGLTSRRFSLAAGAISACSGSVCFAQARPAATIAVLLTLNLIVLLAIAWVALNVYHRLDGVNLKAVDFELRQRRIDAQKRTRRLPDGVG